MEKECIVEEKNFETNDFAGIAKLLFSYDSMCLPPRIVIQTEFSPDDVLSVMNTRGVTQEQALIILKCEFGSKILSEGVLFLYGIPIHDLKEEHLTKQNIDKINRYMNCIGYLCTVIRVTQENLNLNEKHVTHNVQVSLTATS